MKLKEKVYKMLYRKIESVVREHLISLSNKVMVVSGARQVGKSYIIRYVGQQIFENFIEVNFIDDFNGPKLYQNVNTVDDFYLVLGSVVGNKIGDRENTLIFLDEIQKYPQFLTMLKFLREDGRAKIIASGSLLGVTLKTTVSVPVGSIEIVNMYPLDFEEFIIANGVGHNVIESMQSSFANLSSLPQGVHEKLLSLFRRYLLVGGMPDAVNAYLETHSIINVRNVQNSIYELYKVDASQYDSEHRLKITRMYEMIPSNMENLKKRVKFKEIEGKRGARLAQFEDELDYLTSSGIALDVLAVTNPKFPLLESSKKNLVKLYMNDVGLLTSVLYRNNIKPIIEDECSVNLGAVYETAVAMELKALGNILYYYDNKSHGEVDFIVDDYESLSVAPLEVKSGKDYKIHSSLTKFVNTLDYHIPRGYVLSNSGEITMKDKIAYIPVYYAMFFNPNRVAPDNIYF